MFSFRRLRHFWRTLVCASAAEHGRIENSEEADGRRGRALPVLFAAGTALALAALLPGAPVRAQEAGNTAPALAAGQSDSNSGQWGPDETGPGQASQDQASLDQGGQDQASLDQAGQDQTGQADQETQGQISVQERIRQRRAQRRATAIHDAYDHLWESYVGMGYLRFQPGASLQRTTFYGWNTGLTRSYSERFGVDVDARGYYGIAFTGLQQGATNSSDTRPKISVYNVMAGPTYRFYIQPKYSVSGRVLGGFALGNFSGDTNGFGSVHFGIWPDALTYAGAGSLIGQYNVSPGLSIRVSGEYYVTGFGSTTQNSFGFTTGLAYRFGKQ